MPEAIFEHLMGLVDAGVDELIVSLLPNRMESWELFAARVMPELAEA
jgi:hypothetical protein